MRPTPFKCIQRVWQACYGTLYIHRNKMEVSIAADVDFDHTSPTMNDILSHYDLTEEHLKKECPPEVRLRIAKELSEWNLVGRYLGISKQDLTAIGRQYDTEAQKKVAMFDIWHESEGSSATYLKLANALRQHVRKDLVELLCQIVKKTNAEVEKSEMQIRLCMYMYMQNTCIHFTHDIFNTNYFLICRYNQFSKDRNSGRKNF